MKHNGKIKVKGTNLSANLREKSNEQAPSGTPGAKGSWGAHDCETSLSQGVGDHGGNEEKVSRAENDNNIAQRLRPPRTAGTLSWKVISVPCVSQSSTTELSAHTGQRGVKGQLPVGKHSGVMRARVTGG